MSHVGSQMLRISAESEEQFRARLLRVVLIVGSALGTLGVPFFALLWLTEPKFPGRIAIMVTLGWLATCGLSFWFGRYRRRWQTASWILVLATTLAFIAGVFFVDGPQGPAAILLLLPITGAALLIRSWASLVVAVGAIIAYVIALAAAYAGWIPAARVSADSLALQTAVIRLITFALMALVIWVIARQLEQAIRTLREQAIKLGELNAIIESHAATLEQQVAERTAELNQRNQELETLNALARDLTAELDLESLLQNVVEAARRILNVTRSDIFLVNDQGELELCASTSQLQVGGVRCRLGEGLAGWVALYGRSLNISRAGSDPRYVQINGWPDMANQATLVVPLCHKGEIIGALGVSDAAPRVFTEREEMLLTSFANQTSIAIVNARLYQDVQQQLEELKKMQAQLVQAEKLASLGRFAAYVVHEVNNPLGTIRFGLDLLQGAPGEATPADLLPALMAEVDRIARTVRGLLDFAHPDEVVQGSSSLNEVVESVLPLVEPQLRQHRIQMDVTLASQGPVVGMAADSLKEILFNLITNAMDAMPDGGRLAIVTEVEGDQALLRISDTGHGIEPEHLKRVFEPFFT
ncbi:MAG TPA: GAF domain-containing protein, partial [Anaerolineae bacterium]|nr:GAF domain-containing protein [Anaerolineae bacterium]